MTTVDEVRDNTQNVLQTSKWLIGIQLTNAKVKSAKYLLK